MDEMRVMIGGTRYIAHLQCQQDGVLWTWCEPGGSHVRWPRQGEIVAGAGAWLRMRVRVSILSGSC